MAILSPPVVLGMIICLLMPARCSASSDAEAVAGPDWMAAGVLSLADGRLSYLVDGAEVWSRDGDGVLPYRIVATGAPALATTVGPGLDLATHCLGTHGSSYPDYYPVLAGDGWAVLAAMPRTNELPPLAAVLLDRTGAATWRHDSALALWPATGGGGASCPAALYFAATGDIAEDLNEIIYPLGLNPRLASLAPLSGDLRWEREVPTDFPVAYAELLALGEGYGLLSLQYDYLIHELVCFDTVSGAITGRHRLQGLVAQRLAYPGPGSEYLDIGVNGDTFAALVYIEDEGAQRWELDLATGTLDRSPAEFADGSPVEEYPVPVGGAGTPGPGDHPLEQALLPVAAGDAWRVPALVDNAGNTVVATTTGLVVIAPGGDEIDAKR